MLDERIEKETADTRRIAEQVTEIYVLTRKIDNAQFPWLRLPSIHSGFLAATKDGRVFAIQGGPSRGEPKTLLASFYLAEREALHRMGLHKLPGMGEMVPQVTELHAADAMLADGERGQKAETVRLASIVPGQGVKGIRFHDLKGTQTSIMRVMEGPQAQQAFAEMARLAAIMAEARLLYELSPQARDETANCHLFTDMVLDNWKQAGLMTGAEAGRARAFIGRMVGTQENSYRTGWRWLDRTLFDYDQPAPPASPAPPSDPVRAKGRSVGIGAPAV